MTELDRNSLFNHDTLLSSNPYYASGDYLRAKHQLERTDSGRSFPRWALSLAPVTPAARILDAGVGWGRFTWALVEAYNAQPENLLCLDQSVGMLHTAAQETVKRGRQLRLCAGDIETLPVVSAYFDGVMANHVLYHLKDISRGVKELARILKPDGWLLATTNSEQIRVPLLDLHYQALESLGVPFIPEEPSPFSMENGEACLRTAFRRVETFYFEDDVTYTNAADFVAVYTATGRYRNILAAVGVDESLKHNLRPTFERLVTDIIRQEGALHTPVLMGAFVCTGPISD